MSFKKKIYAYSVGEMTEEEKKAFVLKCENEFEEQLERAAKILIDEKCRLITLSGPTCSGKTTTANRFISAFEASGFKTGVISIDDFFKAKEVIEKESKERGLSEIDYDSANAIDLVLFKKCIDDILEKKMVKLPVFSFYEGKCVSFKEFDSSVYDCIIIEGIQAVYPEITELLPHDYKSVQISVATDVEVNGRFFTSRQIRFLRRMIRDAKFRGAPPEFTFEIWKGVSENEDKYIIPFEGKCDIELDSYMEYEPFMINNTVESLLTNIPDD